MENHFNCIYLYTNKVNGKKYVGQAVDFIKRHKSHIYGAYNENQKYDYNVPFHNAIRRHGIENFEIKILKENLQNQEELNYWECYYIVEFNTLAKNQKGYNLASGGYGNPYAGKSDEELAEIRRKQSETYHNKSDEELAEIRRKNSETNKETWKNKSDEEKAERSRKFSETMKNKSDEEVAEVNRKKSEAWKNKSDEELAEISRKHSEAHKGEKNGMYGKQHTEETRAKISETLKGEKNPRARKIISVDPITRLPVFTWQYKRQATEFFGISISTLNYYLKGKTKKGHEYNGFLWYYAEEYEQMNK